MKNDNEYKYIQFPLCLLQLTYHNPMEGLNIILDTGIVHFAMKCRYDLEEVARQLMYAYYRKNELLQSSLHKKMERYVSNGLLEIDHDYNGFDGKKFEPEQSIQDLLKLFSSDQDFKEEAILRYQIAQAEDFLNIT